MKKKGSLKLSSAAKGAGLAGLRKRQEGHQLTDCKGDENGQSGRPSTKEILFSDFGGWTVFYLNCSCRSCLFTLCPLLFTNTEILPCYPQVGGSELEEAECTELM